jgi:hypothetical protein
MVESFDSMASSALTLDTPTSFTKHPYNPLNGRVGCALLLHDVKVTNLFVGTRILL